MQNLKSDSTEFSLNREEAFALLCNYTKSPSLIKHALAVEACCRFYAEKYQEDVELYGITGLLHDFDYEKFPEFSVEQKTGHPFKGCDILNELGYPEVMTTAILGHANYSGVKRESLLSKVLFACDEASGLVMASVLVRPSKDFTGLEVSSVKKKFKDKAFARGCNRDDINDGCQELGVPLEEHLGNIITAMSGISEKLL